MMREKHKCSVLLFVSEYSQKTSNKIFHTMYKKSEDPFQQPFKI